MIYKMIAEITIDQNLIAPLQSTEPSLKVD
jgi:hypothetical protein